MIRRSRRNGQPRTPVALDEAPTQRSKRPTEPIRRKLRRWLRDVKLGGGAILVVAALLGALVTVAIRYYGIADAEDLAQKVDREEFLRHEQRIERRLDRMSAQSERRDERLEDNQLQIMRALGVSRRGE